jgi:hypothetical protein
MPVIDLGFREKTILATITAAIFALGLYPAEPMRKTELAAREYQALVTTARAPVETPVAQAMTRSSIHESVR